MSNLKISIVTVCYNAGTILEKTILSVLEQSYDNIEYIIIDGASQDSTKYLLDKYQEKVDVIISEPDSGIYDAMNKGILRATGDYINFMNAGDVFSSSKVIEDIVSRINPVSDVIYGNSVMMLPNGKCKQVKSEQNIRLLSKRPVYRHNASFTRLTLHKNVLFELNKQEEYKYALDFNHIFNIYCKGAVFQKVEIDVVNWLKDGVSDKPIMNVILNYKISHQYVKPTFKEKMIYYYDLLKACRRELLRVAYKPIATQNN